METVSPALVTDLHAGAPPAAGRSLRRAHAGPVEPRRDAMTPGTMTPDVVLRDITKSFGQTPVLRGVSLDIAGGEFLTLLGPSGCGKSTLLRILAGLETQDDGTVSIGGRPVDALPPKQRDVAMVFQSYALYPHLTVGQNLALPLRMRRLSKPQQ